MAETTNRLPLSGIRVADFTQVIVGPFVTQWLGFMGAEVITIESKQRLSERMRAYYADGKRGPNRSGGFNLLHCNKKSCTIDLTHPRGLELAKDLIKISDVVAENFGTGTMEKLGLGYSVVREIRPDIVMLSVGAFGRTGPEKDHVGLHSAVMLASGQAAMTGYEGGHPRMVGAVLSDPFGGIYGVLAVLHALYHRSKTGEGQYIDESMVEATMTILPEGILDYTMNNREWQRMGNRDKIKSPHNVYRCKGEDRWVAISISSQDEWSALCHALGHPEWCEDERFADELSRWRHQKELDPLIEQWTRERTPFEAMEALQEAGVPAGPSFTPKDLLDDPHLKERGFIVETNHPEVGRRPMLGVPWKMSRMPEVSYKPAPLLGEHNDYVFRELLGMFKAKMAKLVEEKAIY